MLTFLCTAMLQALGAAEAPAQHTSQASRVAPDQAVVRSASPPCMACVVIGVDAEAAASLAATDRPLGGLRLLIDSSEGRAAQAVQQLRARGAEVVLAVSTSALNDGPTPLDAATHVLLDAGSAAPRDARVFEIRRAAIRARAINARLSIGLAASLADLDAGLARDLEGYVDFFVVAGAEPATLAALEARQPGVSLWSDRRGQPVRTVRDLLRAASVADDRSVIITAGRIEAPEIVTAVEQLAPLLPAGLGPLADVNVQCGSVCDRAVYLHPMTLDAIAVVHPAEPLTTVTVSPAGVLATPYPRIPASGFSAVRAARQQILTFSPPRQDSFVLQLVGWRGTNESVVQSRVEVTARRRLTLPEILARHQTWRAEQEALAETVISHGATLLTFEVPGFAGPLTVTAQTTTFAKRDEPTDIVQRAIRVNGLDLGAFGREARLPLIEPERIVATPLALRLDERYRYGLDGEDRIGTVPCYVVSFVPRDSAQALVRGRAWIAADSFALVRSEFTQTALRGPIVSSQQHEEYESVAVSERRVWLPSRTAMYQIYEAVGRRTPIHRDVQALRHVVNASDFDAQRAAAHASSDVMLRETADGLRYLDRPSRLSTRSGRPEPVEGRAADPSGIVPAPRVVRPSRLRPVRTIALGVVVDPNINLPLPFAGLSYLDFNLLRTGTQVNAFFGGTYGQLSWQIPRLGRTRWQLAGDAFGIAVHYNDRAFRGGREQYRENLEQRPAHVGMALLTPLSSRVRIRAGYDFDYVAYRRGESTAPSFRVPADARVHAARFGLEAERNAWSGTLWWSPAWRQGWHAWGLDEAPEATSGSFQRYSVSVARSLVLSPTLVGRVEAAAMGGRHLDRFSRFAFGTFDNRLRGYPGASVRYDRGGVFRSVMAWTVTPKARLDGFLDIALVRDPGLSRGPKALPGIGAALEVPLPFGVLGAVEWGYGVQALRSDGGKGTQTLRVTAYKLF